MKETDAIDEVNRLKNILENTTEGWWEWDLLTNETYNSPGWYRMLGYEPEDFKIDSSTWLQFIHQEDLNRVLIERENQIRKGNLTILTFRMLKKDGEYCWIESRGNVALRDENGNPIKASGIHLNVDDRYKIAELESDNLIQEELLTGIIRTSFSSLTIYNFLEKKMVYSQGLVLNKLGYDVEEHSSLAANFFKDILHPDDDLKITSHLKKLEQADSFKTLNCIVRLKNKAGEYNWIAFRDSVFSKTKSGTPDLIIGKAVDITNYRILKDKIAENIKRLESLSSRNSHELRAPVVTILGLLNLIKHELELDEDVKDLIESLEKTIYKMDTVIKDFGQALAKKV